VSQWPQLNLAALVANGYVVLMPNPRGSYGQGEAFTQANVKDFGYGDLRDIVRGVDAAVAAAPIDKNRAGIWGWSYGGYMTMWAVTQTQRFKAAVAGAGLSNWQSYYGQNSIDQWMIPFFGASVYDDPYIYRRSSPIEFIRNVKTPTLVLVGDRDGEVPAPQSFDEQVAVGQRHVCYLYRLRSNDRVIDRARAIAKAPPIWLRWKFCFNRERFWRRRYIDCDLAEAFS
jgi:dipeptidyl aminopeptidase/acylaminoacyl peptidase